MGELFADTKFFFRKKLAADTDVTVWPSDSLDVTAKVVCEKCNNSWMSDLESQYAKPAMRDMILSPNPVTLGPQQIVSITTFAFKSSVIADHMQRGKRPFFPADVRRRFARSLRIPGGVQIWLGCIGDLDPHHGIFRMRYANTPIGAVNGFHLYAFTYGIRRLCFQVTAARWTKGRLRRVGGPWLTQGPIWDGFSVPCWPSDGALIHWPPPQHLSNQVLDAFSERWKRVMVPTFSLPT
jgi:hypothetical protein